MPEEPPELPSVGPVPSSPDPAPLPVPSPSDVPESGPGFSDDESPLPQATPIAVMRTAAVHAMRAFMGEWYHPPTPVAQPPAREARVATSSKGRAVAFSPLVK